MEKKRSAGVMKLGIFTFLFGLYNIYGGVVIFYRNRSLFSISIPFSCVYYFTYGIILILTGVLLLKLNNWGRILLFFVSSFQIILSLYSIWFFSILITHKNYSGPSWLVYEPFVFNIALLVTYIYIVYYLTRPKVKEQFVK